MMSPHPVLLEVYRTGDVVEMAKTGGEPLVARLSLGLLKTAFDPDLAKSPSEQRGQADLLNRAMLELEKRRKLRGSVPVDIDQGMVHLAEASGRLLAKMAGLGGQVAVTGGVIGAGMLGTKLLTKPVRAVGNALSHESGPRNYGATNFRVPLGTNQYGQAQVGTLL